VIVVGTPQYQKKYKNKDTSKGNVVAAEGDLINKRMRETEAQKETILPVLRAGDERSSFPPLLQERVYADFRDDRDYFIKTFDLMLSIYSISPETPATADLRESLKRG
jgi:hypothetical protein